MKTDSEPPSSPTQPMLERRKKILGAAACLVVAWWLVSLFSCSGPESGSKSSSESYFHPVNEQVKLKEGTFACAKVDDLTRIIHLLRQNDTVAAQQQFARSDCENIQQGTQAIVENNSGWNEAVCIRPAGRPACVWVYDRFLVKVQASQ